MSPAHKVRRYFIVVCLASVVFLAGLSWQLLTRWDVIRFSPAQGQGGHAGCARPHGHGHGHVESRGRGRRRPGAETRRRGEAAAVAWTR